MLVNFGQLFRPGHEVLLVSGQPFKLGESYNNIIRDQNLQVTFRNDGTVNIMLLELENAEPDEAYRVCNNFILRAFPGKVRFQKDEYDDATVYTGLIESSGTVKENGKKVLRKVIITNSLCISKEREDKFHKGIEIELVKYEV